MSAQGAYSSVSHFRRLVVDLLQFAAAVPSATVERRMDLACLVEAREACESAPSWSAMILKAFAVVAARTPALRTSYVNFPWPRFYEHPTNIATLNIDRQLPTERIVLQVHIAEPERRSLQEIDRLILGYQQLPVEEIPEYRTASRMSRVPWPFRQWLWWGALNVFGTTRCQNFGTFNITSVCCHGAGILHLGTLLTSTLHYGVLDESGTLEMRLTFDHRVVDGAAIAMALQDMEQILVGEILNECRSLKNAPAAVAE